MNGRAALLLISVINAAYPQDSQSCPSIPLARLPDAHCVHFEWADSDAHEPLDTTRRNLVSSYVQQPSLSITETTFLLGVGDTSNFTRTCKWWDEMSPSVISGTGDHPVFIVSAR
jgi:hypothetical protein